MTTPTRDRTGTARGTFEVQLSPMSAVEDEAPSGASRMAIDKTFHGDLSGTSRGQMLGLRTPVDGSAGYVAMERVEGRIAGRSGAFVLQHSSTMRRGEPRQSITVVPDSATGELEGLSGFMTIEIEGGEHRYVFEYSFPG